MRRFLALLLAAAAVCYGELADFQKGAILYEWEANPDFYECKKVFMEAFIKCYDPIPLEVLGKPSRADMIQWLSDAYDEIYSEFLQNPCHLRWLTAKSNGEAVGCLLIDLEKAPDEVYLAEMAVSPEHQREKIASTMVRSLFEQIPDAKRFVVITRRANEEAKGFYRALGFVDSDYMHEGYCPKVYTGFEFTRDPR